MSERTEVPHAPVAPARRLVGSLALPRIAVLVGLMALAGCGSSRPAPRSAPGALLDKPVSFTLVSNEGSPTTVPLAGKVTVLDYWAPTCKPCREKLPALVAKRRAIEQAGGELVLVAELADNESTDLAQRTLASWGVPGQGFLVDHDEVSTRQAGVAALPTTQVYDKHGTLRWIAPTTATADDVVEAVEHYR